MMEGQTRRGWLASLVSVGAAGLAGCLGGSDDWPPREPGDEFAPVSLTIDDPDVMDIVVTGTVITGFSTHRPAAIELVFENTADEPREFQGSAYAAMPVEDLASTNPETNSELLAIPLSGRETGDIRVRHPELPERVVGFPTEPEEGCWRLDGIVPIGTDARGLNERFTIDGGEQLTEVLEFYAARADGEEAPPCHPPGTYSYSTHISIDGSAFLWGFELAVGNQ